MDTAYVEMAKEQVDIARLEYAFTAFIARHVTFRSFITKEGKMQALSTSPMFKLEHISEYMVSPNTAKNADNNRAADDRRLATRANMLEMGIDVFTWPLFDVRVTHMSPTSSAVHIAVSLFLMDAMSDLILRQELSALYRAGPKQAISRILPPAGKLAFKDYCTALDAQLPQSDTYALWARGGAYQPDPGLKCLHAFLECSVSHRCVLSDI